MANGGEKKSILEIVLLPLAIAVVGVAGSFIITWFEQKNTIRLENAQLAAAKEHADAERQVKLIDIFSQEIMGENEERQQLALGLLGAIDSKVAGKLAEAVANNAKSEKVRAQATLEIARAEQRTFDKEVIKQIQPLAITDPASAKEPAPSKDQANDCAIFSSGTREQWNEMYLKDIQPGTWQVFVASLPRLSTTSAADAEKEAFKSRFKNVDFDVIQTFSTQSLLNFRRAVVIAKGLKDKQEAQNLAFLADKCGIAKGAYAYQQSL